MNGGLEVPGRGGKKETLAKTDFFVGTAVSPFKRHERELMPQYYKLLRKIRGGGSGHSAVGLRHAEVPRDSSCWPPAAWWTLRHRQRLPFDAGRRQALQQRQARRLRGQRRIAGECEKYAAGPDKGQAFFREFAAKQLAVFRGLGFAAGYLGECQAGHLFQIIDLAESYAASDWQEFLKEIRFSQQSANDTSPAAVCSACSVCGDRRETCRCKGHKPWKSSWTGLWPEGTMTQDDVMKRVEEFASTLAPVPLVAVPNESERWAKTGSDSENVKRKVEEDGGASVLGWQFWQHRVDDLPGLISANRHEIWRSPAGQLIEVTPYTAPVPIKGRDGGMLFLPDEKAAPEKSCGFGRSRYAPLTPIKKITKLVQDLETLEATLAEAFEPKVCSQTRIVVTG